MITCRRAAGLISRGLDADLAFYLRAVVGYHTLVCGSCRRFRRQVAAVDAAAADLLARPGGFGPAVALPDDVRGQLKGVIRDELDRGR